MLTIPVEAGPPCTVALEKERFQIINRLNGRGSPHVQAERGSQGAHLHPGLDQIKGLEHESGASGAEASRREGRGQDSSSPFLVHLCI